MPLWSPSAERVRVAVADKLAEVDDSHTSGRDLGWQVEGMVRCRTRRRFPE